VFKRKIRSLRGKLVFVTGAASGLAQPSPRRPPAKVLSCT
jgi:hypothetical protein